MKRMLTYIVHIVLVGSVALGLQAATYYPITVNYDPGYGTDEQPIADFPVLVRIPANSPIYEDAGDDGENLRFTNSQNVNIIYPHEIDTWNALGESLVWVKLPMLTKDATFRLYCSGEDTTAAKDVWSGYAGVWHLNAAVDSAEKDIYNEAATTKFFAGTQLVTDAPIGNGQGQPAKGVGPVFGSKVYIEKGANAGPIQLSDANRFTVSCWYRMTNETYGDYTWKSFLGARTAANGGWGATPCGSSSKPQLRVELTNSGNTWKTYDLPVDATKFDGELWGLNKWCHIDIVYNNKSHEVFFNGISIGSIENLTDVAKWDWAGWMGWGGLIGGDGVVNKAADAGAFDFDECRIFDGVASAKRIAADYATVIDSSFLTIGPATEEQEIPPGTVAQVGSTYYQDFDVAVAASKASGTCIVLMANDQSWTFTTEGESLDIALGGSEFQAINGLDESNYYIEATENLDTGVTTYTLLKQIKVAAMRNVAIWKELHTRDLAELLPAQVAGLAADGSIIGMFDVVWSVKDITVYDYFGVTPIPGVVTVGGEQLPVTAFVRATLSYSDGYHNIAQEADSMVLTAPAIGDYPLIDDPTKISSSSPSMITNGLSAMTEVGKWIDANGSLSNWNSGKMNPYLDVKFDWGEAKQIYRIEVIARTTGNVQLKGIVITADGEEISSSMPTPNVRGSELVNAQYNHRYDFATPIEAQSVNITLEQGLSNGASTHMDLEEILIWSDGGPIDQAAVSTSADLEKLEIDGEPVALESGRTSYVIQGADEVTLAEGAGNVAVTVLPEENNIIRIVTMAEDGSSKTYKIRTSAGFALYFR